MSLRDESLGLLKLYADRLVFDWSGTILDDTKAVYEANMRVLENYGKQRISFEDWSKTGATCINSVEFFQSQGIRADPEELKMLFKINYEETRKIPEFRPYVYPDTRDTLSFFKDRGKSMSIVSAHEHSILLKELEEYGLDSYFSHVYGSIEDKTKKLLELSEELDVPTSRIAYVGDTNIDMISAKDAGAVAIAKVGGYVEEETLDEVLNDLKNLGHPYYKIYGLFELTSIVA